jgi:hypothetical protein
MAQTLIVEPKCPLAQWIEQRLSSPLGSPALRSNRLASEPGGLRTCSGFSPAYSSKSRGVMSHSPAVVNNRDGSADPVALLLDLQPCVCLRLPRRRHDHLCEAVHPPRLPLLNPPRGLEALRLAGERNHVTGGVEGRDRAGRRPAGDEVFPTRPHIVAQRRHRPQPRYHYPPTAVGAHQSPTSPVFAADKEHLAMVAERLLEQSNPESEFWHPSRNWSIVDRPPAAAVAHAPPRPAGGRESNRAGSRRFAVEAAT